MRASECEGHFSYQHQAGASAHALGMVVAAGNVAGMDGEGDVGEITV